jgi:hypothetical protein
MTWRTTLVAPPDPAAQTAVQVSCRWCPWRSELVDVTEEEGRVKVRLLRKGHDCRTAAEDPEVSDLLAATGLVVGYGQLMDAVHGAFRVPEVKP